MKWPGAVKACVAPAMNPDQLLMELKWSEGLLASDYATMHFGDAQRVQPGARMGN